VATLQPENAHETTCPSWHCQCQADVPVTPAASLTSCLTALPAAACPALTAQLCHSRRLVASCSSPFELSRPFQWPRDERSSRVRPLSPRQSRRVFRTAANLAGRTEACRQLRRRGLRQEVQDVGISSCGELCSASICLRTSSGGRASEVELCYVGVGGTSDTSAHNERLRRGRKICRTGQRGPKVHGDESLTTTTRGAYGNLCASYKSASCSVTRTKISPLTGESLDRSRTAA